MGKPSWGMGLVTPFRAWLHKRWSGDWEGTGRCCLPARTLPGLLDDALVLHHLWACKPLGMEEFWRHRQFCDTEHKYSTVQDSCLRDFPLPPGGFSLHSENRIYGPMHVRKDDKQLATVSAPRWGFYILISSSPCSSLESKHQTSPKGTPMPRNRGLDPTGCKHPRWCRNALHGSQEPDSYLFAHVQQALATQLHWNRQECLQTKVLHTRGEDLNLTFWSLSYCRTGNFRDGNLLQNLKPRITHLV